MNLPFEISPMLSGQIALVCLILLRVFQKEIYLPLLSGKIRAVIFPPTNVPHTHWVRVDSKGCFRLGNSTYETKQVQQVKGDDGKEKPVIVSNDVAFVGMFRTPTYYYTEGTTLPRNMQTGLIQEKRTPEDLDIIKEGHIASDALRSMREKPIDFIQVALAIIVVTMLTGVGVAMYLKDSISKLAIGAV